MSEEVRTVEAEGGCVEYNLNRTVSVFYEGQGTGKTSRTENITSNVLGIL